MSIIIRSLFATISYCLFATSVIGQNSTNEDSCMYYQFHLWDADTYPKSLVECGNTEVAFCSKPKAQSDTLAILETIVANKANYIGQPFSALINQLPIGIRYFLPVQLQTVDTKKR